ncbi:hypothetical protein [Mucilaginibacter ginsenosidivorax]|uniref:Lipoprotein n=1 Tax=Mucilaginibacter ginsenosidivorax TaxID=862126 RepID=A0A5B8VVP2_9SPHI|nr:hypothetical protein [Mucilaginibacter ginsenosidivorax]QEC75489.1 hypothetical protein FSB76_05840 [Mucilaginibacter ginsenosidivorax]
MKLNLPKVLPAILAISLFYAACKKVENKPSSTTTKSADEASSAIAKNLAQSLTGAFGGASIKDGVNPSTTFSASTKLKIQSQDYHCGFYVDTSLNLLFNQGDTLKAHKTGGVRYFFICNDKKTIGYDLLDSVKTVGSGPGYAFTYAIVQDYHVRGLNTNNSNFSLNGKMKAFTDNQYTKYGTGSSVHNLYTFTNLYVHGDDNFDITSGDATFESTGKTTGGGWDYSGTLHFLGNHKVQMTFLNHEYLVDMITGEVKPN